MNTQLDEARRKGATGSRQEEGFTQQDLFAEELRRRFPADEITVTPRGVAGGDVTQAVRLGGHDCGVILWECKRAAKWSGTWIGKLADDVTKARASLGAIVSAESRRPGQLRLGRQHLGDRLPARHHPGRRIARGGYHRVAAQGRQRGPG